MRSIEDALKLVPTMVGWLVKNVLVREGILLQRSEQARASIIAAAEVQSPTLTKNKQKSNAEQLSAKISSRLLP